MMDDLRTVFRDSQRLTSDLPRKNHKIGRGGLELKLGLELNLGLVPRNPTIPHTSAGVKAIHNDVFPSGTIASDLL